MNIRIAIDGPAVSGKSSAARQLAGRLGYIYLDSGAVYRALTLALLRGHWSLECAAQGLAELDLYLEATENGCRVLLRGEDVSSRIRREDVSSSILPVSGSEAVRAWVTDFLRAQASDANVVMDGRDIASVVFPDARFKFFVTASLESRTRRRHEDLRRKGDEADPEAIASQLRRRDHGDRTRKVGPLVKVPEAIEIDNSDLDLDQTVDSMLAHITKQFQGVSY